MRMIAFEYVWGTDAFGLYGGMFGMVESNENGGVYGGEYGN